MNKTNIGTMVNNNIRIIEKKCDISLEDKYECGIFTYDKNSSKSWTPCPNQTKIDGTIFSEKTPDFESYAKKTGPVFSEKVEISLEDFQGDVYREAYKKIYS